MDIDRHAEEFLDASPEMVIASYRRKFGIPLDIPVTSDMIRRHWRTERQGVREILASSPDSRAEIVSRAYTNVFHQCPWLNAHDGGSLSPDKEFSHFLKLLGPAQRVYEIGSGKGRLISWLAAKGLACVGTEVTSERGSRHVTRAPNLEWHTTDGVNLTDHEPAASFDAVMSVQVIEHLHPDDLLRHFETAAALLKPGGRYVLATPHRFSGPADLSAVFGFEHSVCFHLKEYSYGELAPLLRKAGFMDIRAVYTTPFRLKHWLDICLSSHAYLSLLQRVEPLFERLPQPWMRGLIAILHRMAIWRPDIMMVAEKPAAGRDRG